MSQSFTLWSYFLELNMLSFEDKILVKKTHWDGKHFLPVV